MPDEPRIEEPDADEPHADAPDADAPHAATRAAARTFVVTRACWFGVLVLTGVFHLFREAPVDACIFFGGAVAVALDSVGWLRIPLVSRRYRAHRSRSLLTGILIAAAAAVIAVSPLYGGVDAAIVVGIGLLLLPVGWAAPPAASTAGPPRDHVARAAILWSAAIAVGCAWEITVFFLGRSSPEAANSFPALSDLIDPLLAQPVGRAVLVALWLLGGYALIRRVRPS